MYKAIVAKIIVFPHPDADRLQLGNVLGNQVVVGLDTYTSEVGLFFNTDGQLSSEFCIANDLLRRKDSEGKPAGGMFDENNRRVRAQKFRGQKSDGFWIPLTSLNFTGGDISSLKEGDMLDEFNGKSWSTTKLKEDMPIEVKKDISPSTGRPYGTYWLRCLNLKGKYAYALLDSIDIRALRAFAQREDYKGRSAILEYLEQSYPDIYQKAFTKADPNGLVYELIDILKNFEI